MSPNAKSRGFTLVELMVAVLIVGILATMAISVSRSQKQRFEISGMALDLRALLHAARAEALATGHDVAVMVFPDLAIPGGGTGRIIVYSDGDRTLFNAAAAINFQNYDPTTTATGPLSDIVTVFDLPFQYAFGPATGQAPITLNAPYAALPVNADCTFCLGNGAGGRRGAVVFNWQGAARFQSTTGVPTGALAGVVGGSLSLQSVEAPGEVRTVAVVATTGALRSIQSRLR